MNKPGLIIGISGKIGSGKDTVAREIMKAYPEYKFRKVSFGYNVKKIVSILTGIDMRTILSRKIKNEYQSDWRLSVGEMFQIVGTDAIRDTLSEDAWIFSLFNNIKDGENIIITDVRFKNEAHSILNRGGYLIRLTGDPKKIKDNTPDGKIKGKKTPLIIPKLNDTFVDECEFEQVNVVINFQAPLQNDLDYFTMTALNQIMANGISGRLIKATRVTNNLAYSAYSYYSGTKNYGFYRVVSQTSIGKKDELVKVLKYEIQRLIDGDITQEEINLSVESYAKMLDSYFTDDKLVGTMTSYESRGLGYNFLKESLKDLRKVTPEMIKAVANKYLKNAAIITSQPSTDVKRVVE